MPLVNGCCQRQLSTTVGNDSWQRQSQRLFPMTHVNINSIDMGQRVNQSRCLLSTAVVNDNCQRQLQLNSKLESMPLVNGKVNHSCQRREKTNQRHTIRVNVSCQRLMSTALVYDLLLMTQNRGDVTRHDMT